MYLKSKVVSLEHGLPVEVKKVVALVVVKVAHVLATKLFVHLFNGLHHSLLELHGRALSKLKKID